MDKGSWGERESKRKWKDDRKSATVEGKRYCGRLFQPSRLDLDKHWSCSQCFTTIRIAYCFFFSLSLLSLLILLIAHFFSCLATSPFHPHPPHRTPNCSNIISPPPVVLSPFFLPLFILSLPVSRDSICAECCVCVPICEHIETEIHLRAHWFKNTFDIGGPLLQIRSEAYHTHTHT